MRPISGASWFETSHSRLLTMRINAIGLAHPLVQFQHEHEHFGDGLIELSRDLVAELDIGERAGQHLVLLDRDIMLFGDLDDLCADRPLALGDDARRAGAIVMQCDGKLVPGVGTHSARSRKWPAFAGVICGGAPSRMTMSPGDSSASLSACPSSLAPARSCAAVCGRSAHIRTDVRSPDSDT